MLAPNFSQKGVDKRYEAVINYGGSYGSINGSAVQELQLFFPE